MIQALVSDYLLLVVACSAVTTLAVEALLRLWRVDGPDARTRFRLLGLALPPAGVLGFNIAYPARLQPPFRDGLALADVGRWLDREVGGLSLWQPLLLLLAVGAGFFVLQDFWPTDWHRGRGWPLARRRASRRDGARPPREGEFPDLDAALRALAPASVGAGLCACPGAAPSRGSTAPRRASRHVGATCPAPDRRGARRAPTEHRRAGFPTCPAPYPEVLVSTGDAPEAYLSGLRRPLLVLSPSLIRRLDPEELQGVIAHELAHLTRGDLWLGWSVMALCLLMFYNPLAWLTARRLMQDAEMACDALAAGWTGRPLALASGLLKTAPRSAAPGRGVAGWSLGLEDHARRASLKERVRRLLREDSRPFVPCRCCEDTPVPHTRLRRGRPLCLPWGGHGGPPLHDAQRPGAGQEAVRLALLAAGLSALLFFVV